MDNLKRNADAHSENDEQSAKRLRLEEKIDLGDKQEQVLDIIKREFQSEIIKRQQEIYLIQQYLLKAQKTLHLLKYVIVKSFYDKKELKIPVSDESVIINSGISNEIKYPANIQTRIHPAIKKLLGKRPAENVGYDFGRTRGQIQNILSLSFPKEEPIKEETTELEIPTDTEIKETNTNCSDKDIAPIRNRQKVKHTIIIGNISKYLPSNNPQNASTHKWMIYVRGPRENPEISHFVKKVRFFLHPSYQPNDIVELEESPFHLSRRGWGEFPVRIKIHFQNTLNKPVDLIHNLKLDQKHTGRQTLGNETTIDVWLYDSEFKFSSEQIDNLDIDDKKNKKFNSQDINIKEESNDIISLHTDIKEEEDDDEIVDDYYLKSQPGCSKDDFYMNNISRIDAIKTPPVTENESEFIKNAYKIVHLVDHCYAGINLDDILLLNPFAEEEKYIDREKYKIIFPVEKFNSSRQMVYFLFKSLPLITKLANDFDYKCCYPYVASTIEEFTSWNYAKRCCSEWYRAKHIKRMLQDYKIPDEDEWTTKFIMMFGQAHAFSPLATYEMFHSKNEAGKTLPNHANDIEYKSTYTEYIPITTLMENTCLSKIDKSQDEIIDVENLVQDVKEIKVKPIVQNLSTESDANLLPMTNYIKKQAGRININLEDEEIMPGIYNNSAERVILSSVMCLAEELIRCAWANKVIDRKGRNLEWRIDRNDIFRVLLERDEFDIFTNAGLGKNFDTSIWRLNYKTAYFLHPETVLVL